MDLSGVIFVALALVWAVFLIPKALNHHAEVARTRSVGRVSDSLRVLARRERSEGGERLVVGTPDPEPTPEPAPVARTPLRVVSPAARHRKAAAAAARRRRRVLAVLLLSVLAVTVGSLTGLLQPWAPAIPVGLTAAYLLLCRVLVRRQHAAYDAARTRRPVRAVEPDLAAEVAAAVPVFAAPIGQPVHGQPFLGHAAEAVAEVRNDQGLAMVSEGEDTSALDVSEVREAVGGGTLWDPLPMTLPTYVTKPRASRSVRTIDLGAPGVTSSGRGLDDATLAASAPDEGATPRRRATGS